MTTPTYLPLGISCLSLVVATFSAWLSRANAVRTSAVSWQGAHATRTFEALTDLLTATSPERGTSDAVAEAMTRVRLTAPGPLRELAEQVVEARRSFISARRSVESKQQKPYFRLVETARSTAAAAREILLESDDHDACLAIEAWKALEMLHSELDEGDNPHPMPVMKRLRAAGYEEEAVHRLVSAEERRKVRGLLEDAADESAKKRTALESTRDRLVDAVAEWSRKPPTSRTGMR
ncbi:hypothetical protein OG730_09915 [Streptomyces sp. NBC_01298]|uniref:hypothetical protein n=1 Tax=Streptomyces sp. NBC_01298 TaxID=2903817 RepID=UPI002E106A6D|nr:hypothetical protein OG730_09915 [Streptomyces sp. NBC_01298]